MYRYIFNNVKKIIPKISETELIALRTGNVHIDRHIFEGRHIIQSIQLKSHENKF